MLAGWQIQWSIRPPAVFIEYIIDKKFNDINKLNNTISVYHEIFY